EVAERLAGFVEQARTDELRLASSEETPIRTGGTTVTPRSEIAALEESAVRTGGTEVALTHEQVLKISGDVAVVSRVAEGGAEREGGLPTRTPGDESEDGAPSDRRWWVIAVVLVLVLAGGLWLATGEDEGEAVGEGEVAPSVAVQSRERPAAGERTVVDPTVPDHAVVPTEAAVVSEPSAAEIAGGSEAPTAVPSEEAGPAEDSSPPEPPSVAKPEPAKPKPATKPRAKGPDEATCEKKRADATAAKTRRDWTAVLKATMPRACWSGAALKLQRQRLRVEAYAETASFGPCVKEGGKSSDSQISARVRWCSKKL